LKEQGKLDEAIACYRRALELKPDSAGVDYNLGNVLKDQGKLAPGTERHCRLQDWHCLAREPQASKPSQSLDSATLS
jgi:tetratricopeptide (TPR) repeat protein